MENPEEDPDNSITEIVRDYILLPLIRGTSFGLAHFLAFKVLCPFIQKKLTRSS